MATAPRLATYAILAANCAAFTACVAANDGNAGQIGRSLLLRYGAISQATLPGHEYWRLIACAFLHAGIAHLAANMICLLSWGGLVEERTGTWPFVLIYLAAAIGGSLASIAGHSSPFLSIGASGAISGLIGALLALALLRKFPFDAQFFAANILFNIVLVSQNPGIDWLAHLGGMIAGLAAALVLHVAGLLTR